MINKTIKFRVDKNQKTFLKQNKLIKYKQSNQIFKEYICLCTAVKFTIRKGDKLWMGYMK